MTKDSWIVREHICVRHEEEIREIEESNEESEVEIEIEIEEKPEPAPIRLRNSTEGNPTIAEFYRRLGVM